MNQEIITFEIYEIIGIGCGPVGLESLFQEIDELLSQENDSES